MNRIMNQIMMKKKKKKNHRTKSQNTALGGGSHLRHKESNAVVYKSKGDGRIRAHGTGHLLPPLRPHTSTPQNVIPEQVDLVESQIPEPVMKKADRVPMARSGYGRKGEKIDLLANHFKVDVSNLEGQFFHYYVSLAYEDGRRVVGKGIGRKVFDRIHETNRTEFAGTHFAYDGQESLFTAEPLPWKKHEFLVVLEDAVSSRNNGNASPGGHGNPNDADRKRLRRPHQSEKYRVEISLVAEIPMQAIDSALRGEESENSKKALRVLDLILRQHAARQQGFFLLGQSVFYNCRRNFENVGGGGRGSRGFHSSFRTSQGGLSLVIDVCSAMTVKPGPVVDFLLENQNLEKRDAIDWAKAKKMLRNLRIKASHSNTEYKITGLSEKLCKDQLFFLKQRDGEPLEVTVYDYFVNHRQIDLTYSGDFRCIDVGKPKRPIYIPLELCNLVPLQRYTNSPTIRQRDVVFHLSDVEPYERMELLDYALQRTNYGADPMLQSCGIDISNDYTEVEGRILEAPKLKVGNGEDIFPGNGQWGWAFNDKKLFEPKVIRNWAVVNFSSSCSVRRVIDKLIKCGEKIGIHIEEPWDVFEECPLCRGALPVDRVEKMFKVMTLKLRGAPQFLLCLLPESKNSDLYGPWKKKILTEHGIVNQCIAPPPWVDDEYLTNVLLKINAKNGGLNSVLAAEQSLSLPLISKIPTMIVGMDVSHGSPGQTGVPSIAAVVGSRQWPSVSRYRASVRSQSPKVEIINSLFKKVSDSEDEGMMRELLLEFYLSSGKRKPEQIIIFRDGVGESQFNQVLNVELDQIIEACKFLDETWDPKFLVIVAQKKHRTKFFYDDGQVNVDPGTVIDNGVCHPRNNDFYLFSHSDSLGTTKPTHYHVLHDEIGFSVDDLQELVYSLSYVTQRGTKAPSIVAPICYAHQAASQMGQVLNFEEMPETSSSQGGVTSAGAVPLPQLPKLPKDVCNSMFFC